MGVRSLSRSDRRATAVPGALRRGDAAGAVRDAAGAEVPAVLGDGTWHAQIGKWGCDRCKSYLDPAVIAGAQASAAASDAGLKVAKFLLWLILLIALIAVKVALRSHR